jgi:Fe2+ transport system protein FeoA
MGKKVTLIHLNPGDKAKVIGFSTDHEKHGMGMGLARRLQEMGLIPGSIIEVIRNMPTGPVEISVMGTRLAIGRNIASRIYVEKI